ncbi:MAG TPA: outer membrane lipoprotein-sorting protein [Verrucomicrobiae bacterium]|jgi:hypothetical protein
MSLPPAVLGLFAVALSTTAQPRTSPLTPPLHEPAEARLSDAEALRAGQSLAAELRSLRPAQSAGFSGVLKIRDRQGRTRQVPFTTRITTGEASWTAAYDVAATTNQGAEKLRIIHHGSQPNQYFDARAPSDGFQPLPSEQAAIPFAGSDFYLSDLGLDFFHWPHQRLVKKEMRKGRPCQVLSSQPAPGAATNGYARVLSWIDTETGGLLMAEAYATGDRLLKEFEVKSFKKVDGQWQLHDMEIRDVPGKSRTRLEFDLEKN